MDFQILNWIYSTFGTSKAVLTIAKIITLLGNKYVLVGLSLVLLIFKKTRKMAFYIICAGGFAWLLNDYVIKWLVKRNRPFVDNEQFNSVYALLGSELPDGFSMASGHAATAMAFAFTTLLFDKKYGFFAMIYALMVGASRMFLLAHYPTDVLAGFGVGIFAAIIAYIALNIFFKIVFKKFVKYVFATNNKHKLEEARSILKGYTVLSLKDIGFEGDIDENGETLEENAKIKCDVICKFLKEKKLKYAVFADDTGLFVNSLNGEPGVYSARYAEDHNDEANRQKLLSELAKKDDRTAYFKCAICYRNFDTEKIFVGKTEGEILKEYNGENGFGYDRLFLSNELNKSFGEASEDEKNSVSHRGKALKKMKNYLENKKDAK